MSELTDRRRGNLIAGIIRPVGKACSAEGVIPSPEKFSDLAALTYTDEVYHGGQPRDEHARQLVRLLK